MNLEKKEHSFIKEEYNIREKLSKREKSSFTEENKKERFNLLPILDRKQELAINPFSDEWEKRYYKILFDFDYKEENIKSLCINFLEGLEWNFQYYISGCNDWTWYYKYNYPPLLKDLLIYTPYFDTNFIKKTTTEAVHPLVQLSYVLPKTSLDLIPENLKQFLLTNHKDWYDSNYSIQTSFCKYFWESHINLPEINIEELKGIVDNYLITN